MHWLHVVFVCACVASYKGREEEEDQARVVSEGEEEELTLPSCLFLSLSLETCNETNAVGLFKRIRKNKKERARDFWPLAAIKKK